MAKILLMASIVMGYSYATEWFMAWYGGEHADRSLVAFEFTGDLCAALLGAAALQLSCCRRRSGFRPCARSLPASVRDLRSRSISACGSSAS